jgi:hypothetical protein
LPDTIQKELNVRNAVTLKWNSETIWAYTISGGTSAEDRYLSPNLDPKFFDSDFFYCNIQPPLRIAELFYTNHGVPMNEDKDWQGKNLTELRTGTDDEKYYIIKDYTTIEMHFDREPRFYASLGFDGGIWYGQGEFGSDPDKYFTVACRQGQPQRKLSQQNGPITGYYAKKLIAVENQQTARQSYSITPYPFPIIRLSDLYLLYAEAINEAEGPTGANNVEMFKYIDAIRAKTGLPGVKDAWDNYTNNPKYREQRGMREIIHQERNIELIFESQRFWDLRRWMETEDYRSLLQGWDIYGSSPEDFYKRVNLHKLEFALKDYFWPIDLGELEKNPNLVQTMGW